MKYNAIDKGRINCEKAKVCCCLFGGENSSEQDVTSVLSISDVYPIAVPVPSLDKGYVYLTSNYLINTVKDLFLAVGYKEGVDWLESIKKNKGEVIIGVDMKVPLFEVPQGGLSSTLISLGSIAGKLKEGIAVEDNDSNAVLEIERGIIKYTRNKINYDTGTVAEHSLWTEEYLPHGTIFAGIMFFNVPRRNKYCGDEMCDEGCATQYLKGFDKEFYLNVGGKETIGKGIVKVKLLW